ncbi:Ribonuclease P/MRP protein subunit POP5 [Plasmodiophora brassicae]|uniref:Ribonuclease P/MRP protein subunit POP5 n=1 Tax=Plasmodiophora brassicae TaxID=37360 RepID=A0A0G4IYH0_PLABS|nr:hypothetical protein PBRA_008031 [Plasmodiophora brassicae]SPQ95078.1 unnamed protein product [Plasmodiophora brassicae]
MVRFKNRYLLVELIWADGRTDRSLSATMLQRTVKKVIADGFGEFGLAACQHATQVKYFNNATNVAIIRCPRSHHRMVWVALTLLTLYEQRQVIVRVIHNGGTIRSCQKRAIARNLELLHQISAPQDLIDQTARDIMSIDAT